MSNPSPTPPLATGTAIEPTSAASAPLAFVDGTISTMDAARPDADVVIIDGDRIVDVGPSGLLDRWPQATPLNLRGRRLLPGFIDAHNHLSFAALEARWVDLSDVTDHDALEAALRRQAADEADTTWIRGTRWEANGSLPLTRHDLDALGFDRPVILAHFSIHQCVVSSAGLDALGIGADTADPDGGVIKRDARGLPNGILGETAWSLAHARSLAGYDEPDRYGELIERRAQAMLAEGITCIHDAACSPRAQAVYAQLASQSRLPLSVLAMPRPAGLLDPLDDARIAGSSCGAGDEWMRIGPAKLFADGGAFPWIHAHRHGGVTEMGWPFPDLDAQVKIAVDRGFTVGIHAMGNAGLDAALDALESAERRNSGAAAGCRIEHATLASPQQVRRMADLGVVAVVQPGFVDTLGSRIHELEFDHADWMPFASLRDAGLDIAASSDHPCSPSAPAIASRFGITRTTQSGTALNRSESVPLDDWLRFWTAGAAAAGGQLAERGTITPGKRADLVIVDTDPHDPDRLTVDATWIAGEQGHQRSSRPLAT